MEKIIQELLKTQGIKPGDAVVYKGGKTFTKMASTAYTPKDVGYVYLGVGALAAYLFFKR